MAQEHIRVLQNHRARGPLDDSLIRDAVSHRLEVAIEATAKVSEKLLRTEAPEEWPKIVGMRNMLAHQYADLDQEILQNTLDNRLDGFIDTPFGGNPGVHAGEEPIPAVPATRVRVAGPVGTGR